MRFPLRVALRVAALVLLAGCVPANSPDRLSAAGAEAYYQWLLGCLDGLDRDLPAITRSAEQAAAAYVQDGWEIGAYGERGMVGEFNSRAGGMMRTSRPEVLEKPAWQGIVLVFPREEMLAADLATAMEFRKQGKIVIGFGGAAGQQAARNAGLEWNAFIDIHAAPHDGLFPTASGRWVVPTVPTAEIAAVWTWTGEFIGALTRLGKMPPMGLSAMVPGADARWTKYENLKFHEQAPTKVAPGQLGHDYLVELRRNLEVVHRQELGRIVKIAELAVTTRKAGHKVHVFAHGHAIRYQVGLMHDAGYFHQVSRGLFTLIKDHGIGKGDFVFCVGYDRIFQGWYFEDDLDRLRATGATLAWSLTDYNNALDPKIGPVALPKDEIVVGQHWALGDSVVTVPGYDIKILSPSGVVAEAVLWMTEAQMMTILGPDSPVAFP